MGVRLMNLADGQSLVAIARNAESTAGVGEALDTGDAAEDEAGEALDTGDAAAAEEATRVTGALSADAGQDGQSEDES
jgi:hypothetical protein